VPETSPPSFVEWSSFPFEGELRVKKLDEAVPVEPRRKGEDKADCAKCQAPDEVYIWVNENWRVRSLERPSGLPMVLILESRSHLDLGDLPNMLAAELGVMTVRLERAVRSLDGVARVHVNRWGDGAAHLHLWFMARPYGRLQLRGTFLTLWDEILPPIPEPQWRENLALVAAWLAEFGGEPLAKPPRIDWKAPSSFEQLIQTANMADSPDPAPSPDLAAATQPTPAAQPTPATQPTLTQGSAPNRAPAAPPTPHQTATADRS
jgi:diadenosine tetraphosphate (Ap4A) HIT family hydrolase